MRESRAALSMGNLEMSIGELEELRLEQPEGLNLGVL